MEKGNIGLCIIAMMVILQTVAWIMGKDGVITGLVGLVVGGIAGALFGFSINLKPK